MSSCIKLISSKDVFISEDDIEKIISNNKRFVNKFNKYFQQPNDELHVHDDTSCPQENCCHECGEEEEEDTIDVDNKLSCPKETVCNELSSSGSESESNELYVLSSSTEYSKPKHVKSHELIQNIKIQSAEPPHNNPIFNFNIECVVSDTFYKVLYHIYRDIINSYNQLKKFKDNNGKLILTPYQLSALLAVLLNIDEKDISISCEPKIIKKYSDGKILKIHGLKILSSDSKNYQKLINMLTNDFDISIEFINISNRLMNIRYL